MRLYETAIVIDPQLKADEIEDFINKIKSFITNHGGEIVDTDEWGKRRLAYEINRKQYGYYVFIRFNGPGQLLGLLDREYKLSEHVLRYLTIKVDKRALQLEAMQADKAKREAEAEEPAPAAKPAKAPEKATADEKIAEATADAGEESADESTTEEAGEEKSDA